MIGWIKKQIEQYRCKHDWKQIVSENNSLSKTYHTVKTTYICKLCSEKTIGSITIKDK